VSQIMDPCIISLGISYTVNFTNASPDSTNKDELEYGRMCHCEAF